MRRQVFASAIATGLALLGTAAAARGEETVRIDCSSLMSTVEINTCSDREFLKADAELNAVFKMALGKIAADGGDKPYDAKARGAALRAAQRAWVVFRDADCKGAVPLDWGGGTGTTAAVLGCMIERTGARRAEIAERYGVK